MYSKDLVNGCNLAENQGLSTYNGLAAQQNNYAYQAFYNFLQEYSPVRILEIGTGLGGFTRFLRLVAEDVNLNFDIRTYDIHDRHDLESFSSRNIDCRIENVFNADYTTCSQDVIDYIQSEGKTLVLCDGGNKIKEFNLLSNYLKVEDIIMAHDYAPSREYFMENVNLQLWNWLEISDQDIKEACERNNLVPYMEEEFRQAVWVCKIKQ